MNSIQIKTHVPDALSRLLAQYQNSPNFVGLIQAIVGQVQALEDAIFPINAGRQFANAVGAQLDNIGELVGLTRNGLTDAQYRLLLRGAIAQNYGDGTTDTLESIAADMFEAAAVYLKTPNTPVAGGPNAQAILGLGIGSPELPAALLPLVLGILKRSIAAGVVLTHLTQFDAKGAFAFDGSQPWVRGYGSLADPKAGGGLGANLYTDPIQ